MKTINMDQIHSVTIDGTEFKIKSLGWDDELLLSSIIADFSVFQKDDGLSNTDKAKFLIKYKDDIYTIFEKYIVELDGQPDIPRFIRSIKFANMMEIINKLFEISSLDKDEEKN